MKLLSLLFIFLLTVADSSASVTNATRLDVLIVVGAPGEKEYADFFSESAQHWTNACHSAKKTVRLLDSSSGETNQLEELKTIFTSQAEGDEEFWIILIGHGTFDGKESKFNLQGPDISAKEMREILASTSRPLILINTSSSSAPFINELSAEGRIVISATKSGWEENYARFGRFFAKSIAELRADLDKDDQVSVLEAFLMASRDVEDFYKNEKRLATEHALLDDNGDGKGTPSTFYRGVRPDKKPEEAASLDGFRAHQIHFLPNETEAKLSPAVRKRRNELELQLELIRPRKLQLGVDQYLKEIEPILLELGRLYRDAEGSKEDAAK